MKTIPFEHPYIVRIEAESVSLGLKVGKLSGDGGSTKKCSELLEKEFGVPGVLQSPSYTHVLVRLPFFVDLIDSQLDHIITTIQVFRPGSSQ